MDKEQVHTPGPWEVQIGGMNERNVAKIVCTTPRGLKKSIAQVGGYGGDSRIHNARLMAASPELYEALGRCLTEMQGGDYCETGPTAREQALAALSKAGSQE